MCARVLHIAPLWYPISPDGPGGIETLLAALLPALARGGTSVTLVAAGGSSAGVPTRAATDEGVFALMERSEAWDYALYEQQALATAAPLLDDHDVVHSHLGPAALAAGDLARRPFVHTVHGQVTRDVEWYAGRHPDLWWTAVSEWQAAKLRAAGARRVTVVPNGIAFERFAPGDGGERVAFLGRMEPEKGADLAIDAARAAGRPIVLAGPVVDEAFFEERVRPRLDGDASYAGVLGHADKVELLGGSACCLMPSRWDEPFGMVAVEAMACGTPVAALGRGALADLVEEGVTGAVARSEDGLADALRRALALDRGDVRRRAAERFGIDEVAAGYRAVYDEVLAA